MKVLPLYPVCKLLDLHPVSTLLCVFLLFLIWPLPWLTFMQYKILVLIFRISSRIQIFQRVQAIVRSGRTIVKLYPSFFQYFSISLRYPFNINNYTIKNTLLIEYFWYIYFSLHTDIKNIYSCNIFSSQYTICTNCRPFS